MADKIPVSFEYKGRHYSGILDAVSGAAGAMWQLYIGGFYKGQLLYYPSAGEFRFSSQTGEFEELSDYFGTVLISWYQ